MGKKVRTKFSTMVRNIKGVLRNVRAAQSSYTLFLCKVSNSRQQELFSALFLCLFGIPRSWSGPVFPVMHLLLFLGDTDNDFAC